MRSLGVYFFWRPVAGRKKGAGREGPQEEGGGMMSCTRSLYARHSE